MNTFQKWLNTFIKEKGLDLEKEVSVSEKDSFFGTIIGMTYENVVDLIKQSSPEEQKNIKNTLVMIDFNSGRVEEIEKYFNFLADCYIKSNNQKTR